jgi:hypothetical protein
MQDYTGQLLAAARRYAASLEVAPYAKLRICIKIADTGEKVASLLSNPTSEVIKNEEKGIPALSAKQKKIVVALLAGPMKGDALAPACELANRSTLHSGRGMKQLMEWGMVVNDEEDGYTLTEFGEDVANEISEG